MRNHPINILIVDDNALFRKVFRNIVSNQFPLIHFSEASNAAEALPALKRDHPQLVFVDIQLPGPNGLEITRRIKALYPEIIVVILTNYDSFEYREAALKAGADHFLSKKANDSKEALQLIDEGIQRDSKEQGLEGSIKRV